MTSFTIPTVQTERLILRAPRLEDLEPQVDFFASDRSSFIGGPQDRSDTWRSLLRGAGQWVIRGYGLWQIEEKSTGKTAGWAGVINHIEWPEAELGYSLYNGFEGRGLAYEANMAARAYAYEHQGFDTLVSYIDAANTRSIALAERMGARFEAAATVYGYECNIYRHPAKSELGGTC